ncbi:MAG: T9SS type A sorting domain-containing protein [Rhodothermaceae bacterium]|nr:T9SS type A sorting domain-containing protein [Rhodothermaceae bacterium]
MKLRYVLTALLVLASPAAFAQAAASVQGLNLVINEVDADQTSTDNAEFVELYTPDAGNQSLTGFVLVFYNGGDTSPPANGSYLAIDLDGQTTGSDGLFVVCGDAANVANCDLDVSPNTNLIQNGADAVALYLGDDTDFPNDTAPTTTNLFDAVAYGTADSRDDDLLAALGLTVQFEEDYNGEKDTESLQRLNFGVTEPGAARGILPYSNLYYALLPTPGTLNASIITVDETAGVNDLAGWRLLSSPVVTDPFILGAASVDDYAGINLVQGIPAGASNPAQYPSAAPNFLSEYNGDGTFDAPADTDAELPPGQGFFWYWYDNDLTPTGDGTSVSYDLANASFALALTGLPLDDLITGGALGLTQDATADGFYMIGNPYAYPYFTGGATVSDGMLSSIFHAWDPGAGSYTILTADFGTPTNSDAVPVFNGVFAEVTGVMDPAVLFTASTAFVDPTQETLNLIGRTAAAEARLALTLDGTLESGTAVHDEAALLRFRDDAALAWDQHDGSKLAPPSEATEASALIAPVGERDDEAYRQAVRSLPLALSDEISVPLAFRATEAGTFTLGWNLTALPEAWAFRLVDAQTGNEVDLRVEGSYTFTAEATDWIEPLELTIYPAGVVASEPTALPTGSLLSAAYPNPFAQQSRLTLDLAQAERVTVAVYDVLGRRVATLHEGRLEAGRAHAFVVDGSSLSSGSYVVRVEGETFQQSRRLTLIK